MEEMRNGVPVIYGAPVFYLPEDMQGEADILERSDEDHSLFGSYHYRVKEIKLAKNIKEEHIIQAAFYNYILYKIQGFLPTSFSLINRDMEETVYAYEEYESKLKVALEGTLAIIDRREVPSPTRGSCGWPWDIYCDEQAEDVNDVSLVAGVGQSKKVALVSAGFTKVDDVARASEEDLQTLKGIGTATARKIKYSAQAISQGEPVILDLNAIDLPERSVEIFIDLEGTVHPDSELDVPQVDYLIGLLIRQGGQEEYLPFVAHHWDQEGKMFHEYVDYLGTVEDCVIYHWHDYERWHLDQLAERHGISAELRDKMDNARIDLHKVATRAVVFPTYSNSIKDVAYYLGFEWQHEDVDALESVAMYLEYAQDNDAHKDKLKLILDYNEDDCRATMVVKDWLVKLKGEASGKGR